ncbi:iron-containing alcohol dehydrogenase [Trametes meyenii]|nr:iron-containing alcohol dehydrogenase [Trametes meyenii]
MSSLDRTSYDSSDLQGSYAWTDTLQGIYYGPGSIKTALPKLLERLGAKKALIVTGRSLYEKTDVVKAVEKVLNENNAYGATFFEIGQHSPISGIKKGLQIFKDVGADVIVSVGGGSPVDAAKAILYFHQQEIGGPFLRQIAIPTTLSAAEYTAGAGYTNEEGFKVAVSSPELPPAGIILDAELTLATPDRLWLSTGIRALDHAIENLYRPLIPPPLKHLCYAALADLFKYLPESRANPKAIDVRQKLQIASWMSLWPLRLEKYSALGLSHALGHKLGARYSIPHGITSCLTLGPVVALKAEVASAEDKEWLAGALFHLRQPSTGSLEGDILKLSADIRKLVDDLGLHSTLTEYKVPREDLLSIAQQAVGSKDDPVLPKVVSLLESLYA